MPETHDEICATPVLAPVPASEPKPAPAGAETAHPEQHPLESLEGLSMEEIHDLTFNADPELLRLLGLC